VIGIFGGTFDPVHFGHLRPLRELHDALGFERLHLVPAAVPPHRPAPLADAAQRLAMLQLACAGSPDWVVDDRELKREGPSYTVDTLLELRTVYPDATLCLVLGQDAALGLTDWHRWTELFELAGIAIMARPGSTAALPDWARQREVPGRMEFCRDPLGHCYRHPVTPVDISATRVRELVAAGGDITDMVPAAVSDYIRDHGLYRQSTRNRSE
jgi:nicotinate-nucleotide adenylyltransferase